MLYDTSKIISFKKEELLDIIDEMAIYAHFLGFKPLLNQTYVSPLRNDKSPSFSLFMAKNGHILYKDFGTGNSGDCIEFIKELQSITTKQATDQILLLSKNKQIPVLAVKKRLKKIPNSATDIKIKSTPFTKEGLEYWEEYGINTDILNKYEVYQVNKVWINNLLKFTYNKTDLIFAYKLYDRFKIYFPNNSTYRFITNSNIYYIQGWKQLNKNNNTLIITKSLKDVMLLNALGYSAIAPNAESYGIPPTIVSEIKRNFSKVIILYDRDKAGMLNTRKLVKAHNFDFKFIPKKYLTKDISDFYKKYNKLETIKLLSNLIV